MRLASLLKGFFTGKPFSDSEIRAVRSEVSFEGAISAHLAWVGRLREWLIGNTSAPMALDDVCRDDRCDLERWLHGVGGKHFGDLNSFDELVKKHAHFHELACQVVKLSQRGQKENALQLLNGDLKVASSDIVARLKNLSQLFEAGRKIGR